MVIVAYDIEIEPDYIAWQVLMNEISSMWRFTWKWLSCLGDFFIGTNNGIQYSLPTSYKDGLRGFLQSNMCTSLSPSVGNRILGL